MIEQPNLLERLRAAGFSIALRLLVGLFEHLAGAILFALRFHAHYSAESHRPLLRRLRTAFVLSLLARRRAVEIEV